MGVEHDTVVSVLSFWILPDPILPQLLYGHQNFPAEVYQLVNKLDGRLRKILYYLLILPIREVTES